MLDQLAMRAKTALFTRMLSLDPAVVRRLAGRPVRMDGLTLSAQTQLVLRLQKLSMERAAETLPIPQGRVVMRRQAVMVGGSQPIGAVEERTVRGAAGPLPARLYIPTSLVPPVVEEKRSDVSKPRDPLLVFYHGGGMIYGDLDSHDAVCRFLAEHAGVRVLSVDYRLAPEHPFPAGVDDAWAAYEWVSRNAADYGTDAARLAVGGDSAGAYLSAVTAIRAAEEGVDLAFQLLIYPVTDMEGKSESREKFGRDLYLTTEFMGKATENYMGDHDLRDPRASVLYADIPPNLAPAFVATAGFDPLRDEGEAYAQKLADAGVEVEAKRYGGEIHGFVNILGVEGQPRLAMTEMAGKLATALGSTRVAH
jgi:acetyl esterase